MLEAGRGEEGVELRPNIGVAARKKPRRVEGLASGGETSRKVCRVMIRVVERRFLRGVIYEACRGTFVEVVSFEGIVAIHAAWNTLTPRVDALFGHHVEE